MIIDNLYIRLIFHSMTLIYYDIVMIKVNFCKNPYIFTNKKKQKMYTYFNFNASNSKNSNINYSRFTKKKKFNKRFALHYIKVPFIEIRLNRVRENSNSYKYY